MVLDIDRIIKQWKEDQEIRCPHCGEWYPNVEYPVTYWGEDDPVELTCYKCEKSFFVKETVSRTYTVEVTR